MATEHHGVGPSRIQPPRARFRQRRPSLSKEGSHLLNLLRIFASTARSLANVLFHVC
jgi:hypothetical protein